MSATILVAIGMTWQDFTDSLLRARRHFILAWKKKAVITRDHLDSVSNIWLSLDKTKSWEVEINCLPRSSKASPKHAEKELRRPGLERERDTKGSVKAFNWYVSSKTKDKDNTSSVNRVSYAVRRGTEKLKGTWYLLCLRVWWFFKQDLLSLPGLHT